MLYLSAPTSPENSFRAILAMAMGQASVSKAAGTREETPEPQLLPPAPRLLLEPQLLPLALAPQLLPLALAPQQLQLLQQEQMVLGCLEQSCCI